LGDLPMIAEDLGVITPDVEELRAELKLPGMRVLQFAFGSDANNTNLPHNFKQDIVVYTGTHDNDTTAGWFQNVGVEERDSCLEYLHSDGEEINWDLIRAALASVANTAIVPLQDLMGLGSEARLNLPSSAEGNWLWRMTANALTGELSARLRELSELYGRAQEAIGKSEESV
jgi:4-alpha-glucanotransferase